MITRLLTIIILTATVTFPLFAIAGHGHDNHHGTKHKHFDYAKVIDVDPIYKTIRRSTPEQQCWYEDVHKPITRRIHHHNTDNVLIGGIIGGVIGHHLGEGHNKNVATLAGTIIGSAIGHNTGAQTIHTGEYQISQERHCETRTTYRTEERLQGYRVTYRYKGELFTTKMQHHPGKRIRVKVQITPVDREYY
ncbi:MAG: glycine zipper 2TM domain-containing protein [Gammaproteobacteria bacterium]|nr:glycine zipper 2TM domain-containing protein [Gammaproteobacteria bacterium]